MRLLSVLLALAAAAFAATGQTNTAAEVRELSLQDCIQLCLRSNLDLQIDRYNPQLALFTLRGAYGVYDPSLSVSGEHDHSESGAQLLGGGFSIPGAVSDDNSFNSSLGWLSPYGTTFSLRGSATDTYGASSGEGFKTTSGSASFTLDQPLLKNFWIDSSRLAIRVARNRLKYSELTLKLQIMQTVTTLETAYDDLIYDRENVAVQEKAVELAERLVMENKKKLEVGTLAPLDLQSAEAQAASTRAAVIAARSQLETQERVVKQLITDRYSAWAPLGILPTGKLTAPKQSFNVQDSWGKGLTQRPEYLQAKLDLEKQGIQLKYDKNQLLPQLDAFGTYGYNGTGQQFSDALYDLQNVDKRFYTYGGKITIPLANITARNAYKSDKATLQQLVLTLKKLEQTIMISIDNDIGTAKADYDQVQATRAAREYEEAALDAEQKKLENGKSTTYTVLQVQRDLTNARGSEIQALDTYDKSLAQLSLDEGTTLERLAIDFEVK
jgi:outer membrane protein TolC